MVAHGLRILNYCLPDGREEGGSEGEIVEEEEEEGGGFEAAYLHLYINPWFSNQKNQLPPKTLSGYCTSPLFSSSIIMRESLSLSFLRHILICQDSL